MAAVLFDKYFVLNTLGAGGTGRVLLAEHIYLGVKRAIKVIDKDDVLKESFYNEASVLKNLSHSGIPAIYDIEEDESHYYIIEEYIEGESMVSYFKHKSCDISHILDISIQICQILEYVHKSVVHLDIKPQNLLINNNKVYLVDFGSSIEIDGGYRRYHMGTDNYSSPEQKSGCEPDIRSDIYSFGRIMEYMYSECKLHADADLRAVIDRCISRNKEDRFSSIEPVCKYLMRRKKSISNQITLGQDVLRIQVAGTRPGIGVTHFSLLLSSWLCGHGIDAAYVEKNCSGDGRAICKGEDRTCPVVANMGDAICQDMEYTVEVQDVGSTDVTIKAEDGLLILIAGGKVWEIEATLKHIKDLRDSLEEHDDRLVVIFNFLDDRQYKKLVKRYDIISYNMPYVCNPFDTEAVEEFMMKLVNGYLPWLLNDDKRGTIFGKNDSEKVFRFIRQAAQRNVRS